MTTLGPAEENCTDDVPSSEELFRNIDIGHLILIVICCIITACSLGIYIEEIIYILRAESHNRTDRTRPLWILGLYPVVSITSIISICVPRASIANQLVAALYLSMCILQFLKLMISYFGGRDEMLAVLAKEKLNLRSPPCCCCCFCLPEIEINKYNIVKMYYMVLQVVITRPLVFYFSAVYLADIGDKFMTPKGFTTGTSMVHMVSTLVAMYGLVLVHRVSAPHLAKFNIHRKFGTLQLVLLFCNLQGGIFSMLASFGVFPCTPGGFSSKARASNAHHTLLVFEMFLLSLVARYFYRRKEPLDNFRSYIKSSIVDEDILQKETNKAHYGAIHMTDTVLQGLEASGVYTVMPNSDYQTSSTESSVQHDTQTRAPESNSHQSGAEKAVPNNTPSLNKSMSIQEAQI